jgi:hypothetical protein
MINSRHILNLLIELIIKPQALDQTSCYKCNGTKREAAREEVGRHPSPQKKQFLLSKKALSLKEF